MKSYNYKMTVSYDGTKFSGFQKQGNTENTIQAKLEGVLKRMTDENIEVHAAGRTDGGVHAIGQTASFRTTKPFAPDEVRKYLNRYLPEHICVLSVEQAESGFHARFSAKAKTYVYRVLNGDIRNVFELPYVYQYTDCLLDCDKMQQAANLFLGECDLASFCVSSQLKSYDKNGKSTIRRIDEISIYKSDTSMGEIVFTFTGSGFMYNTVRIIVGTLIEVGAGLRSVESVKESISARDRAKAGFKAPACGLTLKQVHYV